MPDLAKQNSPRPPPLPSPSPDTRGRAVDRARASLDAPDCEVRRTAVAKLGEIGTPRAISAMRAARADDERPAAS
jgi:hypothetical protein